MTMDAGGDEVGSCYTYHHHIGKLPGCQRHFGVLYLPHPWYLHEKVNLSVVDYNGTFHR